MNNRAFLALLKENEDDELTRLIYADWLEEQGEYEEATRQRKWTAAKAVLTRFVNEVAEREHADYLENRAFDIEVGNDPKPWKGPSHTLAQIVRMVTDGVKEAVAGETGPYRIEVYTMNYDALQYVGEMQADIILENWAIYTGLEYPKEKSLHFSCCG